MSVIVSIRKRRGWVVAILIDRARTHEYRVEEPADPVAVATGLVRIVWPERNFVVVRHGEFFVAFQEAVTAAS